jgi:hypothetical protein
VTDPRYDKFLNEAGNFFGYIEVPVAELDTPIPPQAKWATDIYGNPRTMRDFSFHVTLSKDRANALVFLMAWDGNIERYDNLTEQEVQEWEAHMTSAGHPIEDWLNFAEFKVRLESTDYLGE